MVFATEQGHRDNKYFTNIKKRIVFNENMMT